MKADERYRTADEMAAGVDHVRRSPADTGTVELIVRRPAPEQREVVDEAQLDLVDGLVGDNWLARGHRRTPDGAAKPDCQITIMNARVIALVAGEQARWPLAGDQLYVDLDLSEANLPAGTRLRVGTAELEITAEPHTGCAKFSARFGPQALRFINVDPNGRELRMRGIYARVVQPGVIRRGDAAVKV